MLTFSYAMPRPAFRRAGAAAALSTAVLLTASLPASADSLFTGGCFGSWRSFSCVGRWGEAGDPYVRTVPQPGDDAAKARSLARDRKWLDRCKPVIAQDRYGVPRYQYTAPGCEFGVGEY